MNRHVELLAKMRDGNYVRLQILETYVSDELVRVVVAYEAIDKSMKVYKACLKAAGK